MIANIEDSQLGMWVFGLLVFLTIASKVKDLTTKKKCLPSPLLVQMEDKFATVKDLEAVEADIRELRCEVKQDVEKIGSKIDKFIDRLEAAQLRTSAQIEAVAKNAYEGRAKLHEKLNQTREDLAALKSKS